MSTPLMGYYAPGDGSDAGTWGSSWNSNGSTFIDNNFAGLTTLSLSSSNVTLSAAQARNQMLRLTGTLLSGITIDAGANLWNGIRCVENVTSGNFAVTLSNSGTCVIPQGRRCVVFLDSSNGPRIIAIAGTSTADPIPSGTVMPFYQASVPAGWSAVALNDYAVKIVTNGGGGVVSGSVTYSTLFARTATDGYTLLTADIPSHTHPFTPTASLIVLSGGGSGSGGGVISAGGVGTVGATGGGGSHAHGLDMRVQTAAFVLGSRN